MPFDATEAGRKIAADAMRGLREDEDARDVLSAFGRDIVGRHRPSLIFPCRDPVECRQHLKVTIAALTELLVAMEALPRTDRLGLFMFEMAIKRLNKKLNAKRRL